MAKEKYEDPYKDFKVTWQSAKMGFQITADKHNFILTRLTKEGKETKDQSYFNSLENCMAKAYDMTLKSKDVKTIEEMQHALKISVDEVKGVYEGLTAEDLKSL